MVNHATGALGHVGVAASFGELLASPSFDARAAWLDDNPEVAGWCLAVRLLEEIAEAGWI